MFEKIARIVGAGAVLSVLPAYLAAQSNRVVVPVDRLTIVKLQGNVPPNARPEFDQGPMDPSQKMSRITLMLRPSDGQQAALEQLLTDQQDPFSPNYHKWLTPEEYADRFGVSPSDIAKIVAWLQSEGLTIDEVARGRNWVWFSGTAGQVQAALHMEIRRYQVDGELHFANATEPSVPLAIKPLLLGFLGLDDFRPKPPSRRRETVMNPDFTTSGGSHFLVPDDLATIYDVAALYRAGYDGSGQKLVVAGQTAIYLDDIRAFRSRFKLPTKDPNVILVPPDPGVTGDLAEADLDLQWSGAVARNADIIYVYSGSVFTSVQYAVNQALAPVISFSYGRCELGLSGTSAGIAQAVAQQANAQGITWLVSSGDSGAAGCDRQGQAALATKGLSANIFAAIPEVTGVGGTQFNEGAGHYWSNTNSDTFASALSYIPEVAWNESAADGLASSGGGLSIFYSRPSWQTGPGVSGSARGVPDVSLTAAGHDAYVIYSNGSISGIAGTSAATPSFAGLIALLNQYQVSKGIQNQSGQGNINPNLYRLAQSTAGVFHDITSGNNIVPCASGSPDCSNGFLGYSAGTGYDLVTGLGSVDANNLITHWSNQSVNTTTVLTADPTNFALNGSTQLTATVKAIGSNGVPTGPVAFNSGNTALGSATLVSSGTGATATLTVLGSQLTGGSNTIFAHYSGSSSFNGSSGSVTVNVTVPNANSAVIPSITPNPVYQQQPDADGYSWFYTLHLTEVAGSATTLTGFTIDGSDYTARINAFFGSSNIAPHGSLSASLRTIGLVVPITRVFIFSGVDPDGRQWSQQLSVPFYGPQITASLTLTSAPTTVRQNPNADPTCPWVQNVGVQEINGHGVQLTRFLAGGNDLSGRIQEFFGSTTVPAFGFLLSGICWTGINPLPGNLDYEVDGIDDGGNQITATMSTLFEGPAASPGVLSVSKTSVGVSVSDPSQSTSADIGVSLTAGQQWSVSVFPSNQTTRWLVASPRSGTGSTNVRIVASGAGLSSGVHTAALVFQSIDALPQFITLPITFSVGTFQPPAIAALDPSSAIAGGGDFTLSVNGTRFASGSVVRWNGQALATTVIGPEQILASVGGALIASPGTNAISVVSSGQTSSPASFGVLSPFGATFANQRVTTLAPPPDDCVVPPSVNSFSVADQTVYLYFEAAVTTADSFSNDWLAPDGTVVSDGFWNPISGDYCFTGGSLAIPGDRLGLWQARVFDNGSLLFSIPFNISRPAPVIASVSPVSAPARSPAVNLTVSGVGFESTSVVRWTQGGQSTSLITQFQNAALLQATVPASLLTSPGTAQIAVAESNNVVSNSVAFTITQVFVVTSLSPASAVAGGGPFTLTVTGTGFVPGTVVQWNGTGLPTTYASPTQLSAWVDGAFLASSGTAAITVSNGGQSSGSMPFSIRSSFGAAFNSQRITTVAPAPNGCVVPPAVSSLSTSVAITVYLYFESVVTTNDSLSNDWLAPDGSVVSGGNWNPVSGNYCFTGASLNIDAGRVGSWQARVFDRGNLLFSVPFSINAPAITSLSPSSAPVHSGGVNLTINGAGFANGVAVRWTQNGQTTNLTTLFQSAGLLQATVPASLLTNPGTAQVTAGSNSVVSNSVSFTIGGGSTPGNVSFAIPGKLNPADGPAVRAKSTSQVSAHYRGAVPGRSANRDIGAGASMPGKGTVDSQDISGSSRGTILYNAAPQQTGIAGSETGPRAIGIPLPAPPSGR